MFEEFLAQMLVLLLCILSGIRIFFIKNPRIDCFAVPAPVAFFVSLFIYFAYGFSPVTLMVSFVALIFALTNIRSVFRLSSKLVIDRYSVTFIISTIIEMILALLVGAFLVYFSPVRIKTEKLGVTKTVKNLTGNTVSNFKICEDFIKNRNINITGFLNIYEPAAKTVQPVQAEELAEESVIIEENASEKEKPLILFVANAFGTVQDYEPYLIFLSQSGYTVLGADFYSPDMPIFESRKDSRLLRKFYVLKEYYDSKKNKTDTFKSIEEKNFANKINGYKQLIQLSKTLYGDRKIYLVFDQVDYDTIFSLMEIDKDRSAGFFSMNRVYEYETAGFGFMNQTNPIYAYLIGRKRDKSLLIPKYVATKTIKDLELTVGSK